MYEYLDSLLAKLKKKLRTEFNRLGIMGFDSLNVVNTKKVTREMFDRLLDNNVKAYQKAAKDAYAKAKKKAKEVGYEAAADAEAGIEGGWLLSAMLSYNLVTGYVYDQEAERKRMRLNEQILTAREYDSREMYNESLRKAANLWYTQTQQYGITVVDEATLKAYKDMGVDKLRWIAKIDKHTCKECRERHKKIYKLSEVPRKTHYNCRCYLEPVEIEE